MIELGGSPASAGPVLPFDNQLIDPGSSPELLTAVEAAKFLRISMSTLRRLIDSRGLRFYKVRGCIRFFKSDLYAYLEKQRVEVIGK